MEDRLENTARREFLKNAAQVLAAAAGLSLFKGCKKKQASQYVGIGGYDPWIEDNKIIVANYIGVQRVPIDHIARPSESHGIALGKESAIETLLDRHELDSLYTRMRFEHPVPVGDKIQFISGYRVYEFIPNNPKSLKPITPEGEYWHDQWKTLQGYVVRQGGKQVNNSGEMFYILKDGKWKSITGVYNFSLTFSPDGKKAYSAGKKIFEYEVIENDDNITMKETKAKNKIRNEFDNVREIKAIPNGYVFVTRKGNHDWEIWRTDLNWNEATCLHRRKEAVLDLRLSKNYIVYDSISKYGGSIVNILPFPPEKK